MRISDWSSDVCSSDLHSLVRLICITKWHRSIEGSESERWLAPAAFGNGKLVMNAAYRRQPAQFRPPPFPVADTISGAAPVTLLAPLDAGNDVCPSSPRSEEHTSELQSLMRISYAVFCLQNTTTTHA